MVALGAERHQVCRVVGQPLGLVGGSGGANGLDVVDFLGAFVVAAAEADLAEWTLREDGQPELSPSARVD